ncbi:Na(+)/H(+) antiporter subunit B [Marinobacter salicampi]|uniref:Na(+)/H(+) antiporter subunit B n=1 Tax=Marinobacter salicampi TaxID=435907 RepID=UPI001408752A|nr:Na(+)/H(+) antiporter subunit B [Marinobacter salicampi]
MKAWFATFVVLAVCVAFTGLLAVTVWDIAQTPALVQLPAMVAEKLSESGVKNPVTAVLLNFRSYDTLLEIGVLVIAAMTGISMARTPTLEDPELRTSNELLFALQRWFVPLMLMVAGYLLWAGSDRPGGAFQAGAVLAAAGVLMRLGARPMNFLRPGILLRLGLVLGFAVFLVVALASAFAGEAFLDYPEGWTKVLIVTIEAVLTLSIGMVLLALFVAGPVNEYGEEDDPV